MEPIFLCLEYGRLPGELVGCGQVAADDAPVVVVTAASYGHHFYEEKKNKSDQ